MDDFVRMDEVQMEPVDMGEIRDFERTELREEVFGGEIGPETDLAEVANRMFQRQMHTGAVLSVPPRFRGGFETLERLPGMETACERAREWLSAAVRGQHLGKGLYLSGPTGDGKTGLAYACAQEFVLHGRSVRVWGMLDLLHALKSSFSGEGAQSEYEIMREAREVDLLVLDDVGADLSGGDWKLDALYLIVNGRYEHMRPVILTSNLNGAALLSHLRAAGKGQAHNADQAMRIVSRLCEMCEGVPIGGGDRRKNRRAN